jgi:hypothetical protein
MKWTNVKPRVALFLLLAPVTMIAARPAPIAGLPALKFPDIPSGAQVSRGVIDTIHQVAYLVNRERGIDARDLATGQLLWTFTSKHQIYWPLAVRGDRLVARTRDRTAGESPPSHIVVIDLHDQKCLLTSQPLVFPRLPGKRPDLMEVGLKAMDVPGYDWRDATRLLPYDPTRIDQFRTFEPSEHLDGNALVIEWESWTGHTRSYEVHNAMWENRKYLLGAGTVRIDLKTGAVDSVRTVPHATETDLRFGCRPLDQVELERVCYGIEEKGIVSLVGPQDEPPGIEFRAVEKATGRLVWTHPVYDRVYLRD